MKKKSDPIQLIYFLFLIMYKAISKKLVNSNILSLLKKDWTNAYLSTPHGKPVRIKQRNI